MKTPDTQLPEEELAAFIRTLYYGRLLGESEWADDRQKIIV